MEQFRLTPRNSSLINLSEPEDKFCLQIEELSDSLKEGDVLLSNHPSAGGTHLPDLTVITPVSCLGPFTKPIKS